MEQRLHADARPNGSGPGDDRGASHEPPRRRELAAFPRYVRPASAAKWQKAKRRINVNMDDELNYSQILDELLAGTDMDDEVSRKMAYNACLACAEELLTENPTVNVFVALAAERLGQVHVYFDVIKNTVPMPGNARLRLRYKEDAPDPELTGNTEGLRYLSDLCAALASVPPLTRTGSEDHLHLDAGEPPMVGNSYGLTIYHSADAWFDRFANPPEDGKETEMEAAPPPREVAPEQVAAIEFYHEEDLVIPPEFYLRYDKLYRVLNCRPYLLGDEVPLKPSAGGGEGRMHVFTFRDDAQEIFEIALDLDDAGIHYFTKNDLEQVWGVDP